MISCMAFPEEMCSEMLSLSSSCAGGCAEILLFLLRHCARPDRKLPHRFAVQSTVRFFFSPPPQAFLTCSALSDSLLCVVSPRGLQQAELQFSDLTTLQ